MINTLRFQLNILFTLFILIFCANLAFAGDENNPFSSMQNAIKKVSADAEEENLKPVSVEEVLTEAVGASIPEPAKTLISLEEVNEKKIYDAYKKIGNSRFDVRQDMDVKTLGVASSILLFASPEGRLKKTISEIVQRGMRDLKSRKIVVYVNSNPIPFARVHSYVPTQTKNQLFTQKLFELDEPELRITLSAGLLASVKTVDELAAQIYKAYALTSPTAFGYKENLSFVEKHPQAKKLLESIQGLSDSLGKQGGYDALKHPPAKLLKAEIFAMDRLVDARYNLWSLYDYNNRVFRWVDEVLLTSKTKLLARRLFLQKYSRDSILYISSQKAPADSKNSSSGIILNDESFALRLQALSTYVAYLDNSKHGSDKLVKTSTSFSFGIKQMQYRLKLYTNGFFAGLPSQIGFVTAGTSIAASAYFLPHFYQSVYQAFINTTDRIGDNFLEIQWVEKSGNTIASVSERVLDWTKITFENSFLNSPFTRNLAEQLLEYDTALITAGSVISVAVLVSRSELIRDYLSIFYDDYEKAASQDKGKSLETLHRDSSYQRRTDANSLKRSTRKLDKSQPGIRFVVDVDRFKIKGVSHYYNSLTNALDFVYQGTTGALKFTASNTASLLKGSASLIALGGVASTKAGKKAATGVKNSAIKWRAFTYSQIQRAGTGIKTRAQALNAKDKSEMIAQSSHVIAGTMGFLFVKAPMTVVKKIVDTKGPIVTKSMSLINYVPRLIADRENVKLELAHSKKQAALAIEKDGRKTKARIRLASLIFKISPDESLTISERLKNANFEKFDLFFRTLLGTIKPADQDIKQEDVTVLKKRLNFIGNILAHAIENKRISRDEFFDFVSVIVKSVEHRWFVENGRPLVSYLNNGREELFFLMQLGALLPKHLPDLHERIGRVRRQQEIKKLIENSNWIRPFLQMEQDLRPLTELSAEERSNFYRQVFLKLPINEDGELFKVHIYEKFLASNVELWFRELALGDSKVLQRAIRMLNSIPWHQKKFDWLLPNERRWSKKSDTVKTVEVLQPWQRLRFYSNVIVSVQQEVAKNTSGEHKGLSYRAFLDRVHSLLDLELKQIVELRFSAASGIEDLLDELSKRQNKYELQSLDFSHALLASLLKNLDMVKTESDVKLFLSSDLFWPDSSTDVQTTPIEKPLVAFMKRSSSEIGLKMNYNPSTLETIHHKLIQKLKDLGKYPGKDEPQKLFELWDRFTERGISTSTDAIFKDLLEVRDEKFVSKLKAYAIESSRVLDQGVRDQFALESVLESTEYKNILKNKFKGQYRKRSISKLVFLAQKKFKGLGIAYSSFLESLSVRIGSTEKEPDLIETMKTRFLTDDLSIQSEMSEEKTDNRLLMFTTMLTYIKKWKKIQQMEFLLFLRGSLQVEDVPYLKKHFPVYGPERARQIFQSLPAPFAMSVVDLYLTETILRGSSVNSGYTKKLITRILADTKDVEARKYAHQMLEALLAGIAGANNDPFQRSVVSALVVMRSEHQDSVGETIKVILEQFPGVGPKIAQYLIPLGVLTDEINIKLRETQDSSLPPTQWQKYMDARELVNGGEVPFRIIADKGSGSMKYTYLAELYESTDHLIHQVFREDVQNNSKLYITILRETVKYLIKKDKTRWSFLDVVVEGAISAVEKEKEVLQEAIKTKRAETELYNDKSGGLVFVEVPEQRHAHDRILMATPAPGINFFKLDAKDKLIIGAKILEMEKSIFFSDKDRFWFDSDRHAGNYLIQIIRSFINQNKKGSRPSSNYSIYPIDFGQLSSISKMEADQVIKLFAIAKLARLYGTNPWVVSELAKLVGLTKNEKTLLSRNLATVFPLHMDLDKAQEEPIKSFYDLLSVINQTVEASASKSLSNTNKLVERDYFENNRLKNIYPDFIRSIIQFKQYEDELTKISPTWQKDFGVNSPISELRTRTSDQILVYSKAMEFSTKQKLLNYGVNAYLWTKSKFTDEKFTRINLGLSREDIRLFEKKSSKVETSQSLKGVDPKEYQKLIDLWSTRKGKALTAVQVKDPKTSRSKNKPTATKSRQKRKGPVQCRKGFK